MSFEEKEIVTETSAEKLEKLEQSIRDTIQKLKDKKKIVTETSTEKLEQSKRDKIQKLKDKKNIKYNNDSNYTHVYTTEQTTFSENTNFGRTFKPTISKFGDLTSFFERPDGTKQYVYYTIEYQGNYNDDDDQNDNIDNGTSNDDQIPR